LLVLREGAIIVSGIHEPAETKLFEIAQTLYLFSLLLGLRKRGEQQARENGNDGNDYQQLNQGKTIVGSISHWKRRRFHFTARSSRNQSAKAAKAPNPWVQTTLHSGCGDAPRL
jgi:hypothetical protein